MSREPISVEDAILKMADQEREIERLKQENEHLRFLVDRRQNSEAVKRTGPRTSWGALRK